MMCITDLDGKKLAGERDPSSEMQMHLEVYRQRPDVNAVVHAHPPIATAFAVAGIALDRAVLAGSGDDARQHPDRGVRDAVHGGAAGGGPPVRQGARRDAAGQPRRAHPRDRLFSAYYKMETIEHFAKISFMARMLGGERLLSREEVMRLQGLRGSYGIAAPAPICTDQVLGDGPADCQVVQAPSSPGRRLVPDANGEIRLTYRELTELIEEAVRALK